MPFRQRRLRIEQVDLTRRAFHIQEDDVLGLAGEMRLLGLEWIDNGRIGSASFLGEQVCQGSHSDSTGSGREEVAAS